MASCHSRGESLVGGSAQPPTDAMAMSLSKLMQSPDNNNASSVAEWRSRSEQMEPSPPSTSPAYWDTDDDDDASNSSSMTGIMILNTVPFSLVYADSNGKRHKNKLGFR